MTNFVVQGVICWACVFVLRLSFALTPAGTTISNQASLYYKFSDNSEGVSQSAPVHFMVLQLLDVSISSLDATPVLVNAPDAKKALSFQITNTGNGTETFVLTRNDQLTGNEFFPTPSDTAIYLESGFEQGFQATGPHADIKYVMGVNDPRIAAGQMKVAYIVSDVPVGVPEHAVAQSALRVTGQHLDSAKTVGSTLGVIESAGQLVEHVLGASKGTAEAQGSYRVSGLLASLSKTVSQITNTSGGKQVVSGSRVTYQLIYELKGNGEAKNIVVKDPLPAHTTYVPRSLRINGRAVDDVLQENEVMRTGVVFASLGDQRPPYRAVVEFDVAVE